jgi:hypothetical protein
MFNLTTIKNGFIMNESEFHFEGEAEILDETQAHVPTDRGVIFMDTTMTIDNESFNNINDFLTKLYGN